jgi:hypothetical protein
MPPVFRVPASVSRAFVFVGFAAVGVISIGLVALRLNHGGPLRFKMLPDGGLALMTRAELLERRRAQALQRVQDNPESKVYADMAEMYTKLLTKELEDHPPPVPISEEEIG